MPANKPLERPGADPRAGIAARSAGHSAPSRLAHEGATGTVEATDEHAAVVPALQLCCDDIPSSTGRRQSMRIRRLTSALLFVFAGSLFLTPSVASPGSKENVAAATMKWAQTLGQNDPDKVVLLYATDGVLWGTLSPTVRADRAALRDYFVTAFKVLPGLKVTFGEQLIRVYGSTAVNTGYYTFSYIKDGETKTLPARYSFTFVKEGENWMIVDHHSSAMPAPPR
jgi:uncharacterized protein (TIGR02246 family)